MNQLRWEYKVVEMNISERWSPKKQRQEVAKLMERLNELGQGGWELISYESIPMTGTFTGNINGYAYLSFLKRPLHG